MNTDVIVQIKSIGRVFALATVGSTFYAFTSEPLHSEMVRWSPHLMLQEVLMEVSHVSIMEEDTIHPVGGAESYPMVVISGCFC